MTNQRPEGDQPDVATNIFYMIGPLILSALLGFTGPAVVGLLGYLVCPVSLAVWIFGRSRKQKAAARSLFIGFGAVLLAAIGIAISLG